MNYRELLTSTPQNEQADPRQIKNNAGGFVFQVGDWEQLKRFLVIGTDQGSFYASPRKLTMQSAAVVARCLDENSVAVLELIKQVSIVGRAPSNEPCILATAMAIAHPSVPTSEAQRLVTTVCRIGTHIFSLAGYLDMLGGWGRKKKRAVASWYEQLAKDPNRLAYQVAKYKQREGWSHRDVLRVSHPVLPEDAAEARGAIDFAIGKPNDLRPALLDAHDELHAATRASQVVGLIERHNGVTWEMIPSQWLAEPIVWGALVDRGMPIGALVRNLGRLGSLGLLKPMSETCVKVAGRLRNPDELNIARMHPISLLKALKTYSSGAGLKGSLTWDPDPNITAALDTAVDLSFGTIQSTGKRMMMALDVSSSMFGNNCANGMLNCAEASTAMALAQHRAESQSVIMGFSHQFVELGIGRNDSMKDAMRSTLGLPFGRTDLALPMQHAEREGLEVDVFSIYTDNETWAGRSGHPHQALKSYRKASGINAKLVVVGMAVNDFSIADPKDPGMMDCVGFDTATPNVISEFAAE